MPIEYETLKKNIANLLSPYADGMEDVRLGEFLALSVGRILMKSNDDENMFDDRNDLRHITDWLKASIINNAAWLSNVDDLNRPKKLMKFNSIKSIVKEADKAMLRAAQKLIDTKLEDGDEQILAELSDGYYIVKLLTPRALDKESAQMQHCIGQGAYDEYLDDNRYQFFSLRDASGKSHVTIEMYDNEVIDEIRGKQNKCPHQKYLDILVPYFQSQKYFHTLALSNILYAVDVNRNWHRYDQIPDNTTFDRSLNFIDLDIKELPKKMKLIKGLNSCSDMVNLYLDRTEIVSLPDGLECEGGISLNGSKIEKLPENLKVYFLSLNDTLIKELPEGLHVKGLLELVGTSKLEKIPDNLYVGSGLLLKKSGLTKLPKGLNVGDLNLICTKIKEIPEDTIIRGGLFIADSEIKKLPENIKYYDFLMGFESKLEALPDNLHIKYDLAINGSMVKTLPQGLSGEYLIMDQTAITELPEDIKVKNIHLRIDQIDRVPDICVEMNTTFIFKYQGPLAHIITINAKEYQAICEETRKQNRHQV